MKDDSGLLTAATPKVRVTDLAGPPEVKERLRRVIREQRSASKLKNHGLSPRRKLLLVGPPGTGKTFTASILAGELDFPLFQVRLDALITKFMAETSAKLRLVFDALGSQRGIPNDVGEARRILNSFQQMIEQDQSTSLIVCATNHEEILDHALFRRFDDVVHYQLPGPDEILKLFRDRLSGYVGKDFDWSQLPELAEGLSSAEIALVAQDAVKGMLIEDRKSVSMAQLKAAITDRRGITHKITR